MKKITALLLCFAMICSGAAVFAEDSSVVVNVNGTELTSEPKDSPNASEQPTIVSTDVPEASEEPSPEPAEETEQPSATQSTTAVPAPEQTSAPAVDPALLSSQVTMHVQMYQQPYTIDSVARFELYSMNGELLATDEQWIGGITTDLYCTFTVPEYAMGESFKLKLASGLNYLKYYDSYIYEGQDVVLQTYSYIDENGALITEDNFELGAMPYFNKSVTVKYDGVPVSLYPGAMVLDGTSMVPIRSLAEYIGMDVTYNSDYNVEIVSLGDKKIYFNIDTVYTTVFGTDLNAPYPTVMLNGTVYVALRTFADAIGSTLTVTDNGTSLIVDMSSSTAVQQYYNSIPVNARGITSRTNYLVWISLSEYKLRVYSGKQYQWTPIHECTCAIGAPGSPTITGQYEYQYSMPRWDYGTYYVGPCLVFYGNYAIHSVFLYQNGTEYDGRVGMQLSHGCIRLKKYDIDWLYSTIPIGTRIYITP